MRKLAALLALAVVAGCQERVTAPPSAMAPSAPRAVYVPPTIDNPPPPPLDTGMAMTYDGGSALLNATYFLNRPGTNGWLTVASGGDVSVTPDARVSYHRGTFSGKGTVGVQTNAGLVLVDLSSVSQRSSFSDCSKTCFSLAFDSATLTDGQGTRSLESVTFAPVRFVRGE